MVVHCSYYSYLGYHLDYIWHTYEGFSWLNHIGEKIHTKSQTPEVISVLLTYLQWPFHRIYIYPNISNILEIHLITTFF